jgi:chromate transporter
VTFVPCFLFVLLGAPYVERLRGNHAPSAALTGITAAVLGVIANLGLLCRPRPDRRAGRPARHLSCTDEPPRPATRVDPIASVVPHMSRISVRFLPAAARRVNRRAVRVTVQRRTMTTDKLAGLP